VTRWLIVWRNRASSSGMEIVPMLIASDGWRLLTSIE
jgi:hypothetical protein